MASAQVDLNPHQVDAARFAFNSPLAKGALWRMKLAWERPLKPDSSFLKMGRTKTADSCHYTFEPSQTVVSRGDEKFFLPLPDP